MSERTRTQILTAISIFATVLIITGGFGDDSQARALAAALRGGTAPTNVALPAAADTSASSETADAADTGSDAADTSGTDTSSDAVDAAAPDAGAGTSETPTTTTKSKPAAVEPSATRVKHVFQIVLAGRGFEQTFGATAGSSYLNRELRPKGVLLTEAASLGRSDVADHLALISGQAPNADTRAGCPTYVEKTCVYPNTVTTIADQLRSTGTPWRAYVEDLDKTGRATCRRPASNAVDDTATGRPDDGYAARHNPFIYFHSLLDLGGCDEADGPLSRLDADLATVKSTPAYSYIVPNLCNDGTESPCVDGAAGGTAAADAFLEAWVPKILNSQAYKDDGVLIITYAGSVGAASDEPARNGALVLSRFVTPGTTSDVKVDPYVLLHTAQDLLALKPLGKAVGSISLLDSVLVGARIPKPGDD